MMRSIDPVPLVSNGSALSDCARSSSSMLRRMAGVGALGGIAGCVGYTAYCRDVSRTAAPPTHGLLKPIMTNDTIHIDTWEVRVAGAVDVKEFTRAFFTSAVFRQERKVLWAAGMGSATDEAILAWQFAGDEKLAVFELAGSSDTEILFVWDKNLSGYSCFHADACPASGDTLLRFSSMLDTRGSVVIHLAMPLHLLYARLCLASAAHRLAGMRS